jgi:hypothetical protein
MVEATCFWSLFYSPSFGFSRNLEDKLSPLSFALLMMFITAWFFFRTPTTILLEPAKVTTSSLLGAFQEEHFGSINVVVEIKKIGGMRPHNEYWMMADVQLKESRPDVGFQYKVPLILIKSFGFNPVELNELIFELEKLNEP